MVRSRVGRVSRSSLTIRISEFSVPQANGPLLGDSTLNVAVRVEVVSFTRLGDCSVVPKRRLSSNLKYLGCHSTNLLQNFRENCPQLLAGLSV